ESESCLDDKKVKKLPLTVNAIKIPYQITDPQPQLFVTESCRHMSQVLEEFGRQMCCSRGGASALQETVEAGTVNSATTNAGIQISGLFSRVITDAVGNAIYFNTSGQSQLAYQGTELPGHGIDYHKAGFGSPVGRLRSFERCLSNYTIDELKRHHIEVGQEVVLHFLSGITVSGLLTKILRRDQKNLLFTFEDCTVIDDFGKVLFEPEWGTYDMSIGESISSVTGGSADQHSFPLYDAPSSKVTVEQDYDQQTRQLFDWYQKIRDAREADLPNKHVASLIREVSQLDDADWLLIFEALELAVQRGLHDEVVNKLHKQLLKLSEQHGGDEAILIGYALNRLQL
ncbi:MAG: hypothetical protein KJP04_02700, partial [Arenicella sp.]|nr:hypothetical protein [Arenicella sp.]